MGKVAVVSLEFMVPDLCVACGGPALPKKRRVVKDEVGVIAMGQDFTKGGNNSLISLLPERITCVGGVMVAISR